MTPREKAEELVGSFYMKGLKWSNPPKQIKSSLLIIPKQCALIAVDEIIKNLELIPYEVIRECNIKWWQEVKQEIEKL